MYNLETLKLKIARSVPDSIKYQFSPNLSDADLSKARKAENWKVHTKAKFVLILDCKPFDDQLRCYVYLNPNRDVISLSYSAE